MDEMTWRERAAINILLFIVRMLNPTKHQFQVDELRKAVLEPPQSGEGE
tara:strand:- start:15456 stop:15602 length:147 start_codon:yes stop_codon:yes gene_type:complete